MLRTVIAVVAIAIILLGSVGAIKAAYQTEVEGAGDAQTFNESFNVSAGTLVALNESNRDVVYGDTVTVTNDGSTVSESEYDWNEHNGTLKVTEGSAIANEKSYVNYSLTEPTNQQKLSRDVGMLPADTLGGALLEVASVAMVLGAVVIFMRMGGR